MCSFLLSESHLGIFFPNQHAIIAESFAVYNQRTAYKTEIED